MSSRMFISHISEEASVAARLKVTLMKDFLGLLAVFVSSDTESIAAGEEWLTSISHALHESSIFLVLCSPTSILRPWINFEAGAAWMRDIPVIPLCHAGLKTRDLPMPLAARQGVALDDAEGLRRLYGQIATVLRCQTPQRSYEALVRELGSVDAQDADPAMTRTLNTDQAVKSRLHEALSHPRFKWRSLDQVAIAAGVTADVATRLLQVDERIRFSKGKLGNTIVGLRSRVG
jgi:TIR domain-containing protein